MDHNPSAVASPVRFRLAVLVALMAFASATLAATAWAADVQYGGEWCGHSKRTVLIAGPELTVWSGESWGIQTSEGTFAPWKLASVHCVSYGQVLTGKYSGNGSCTFTDPDGDSFTGAWQSTGGQPNVWTFLAGTGKWNGIQGHGTFKVEANHKRFPDGTGAFCLVHSGTYTLPQ